VFTNSTNEHLPGPRARNWDDVLELAREAKARWERAAER